VSQYTSNDVHHSTISLSVVDCHGNSGRQLLVTAIDSHQDDLGVAPIKGYMIVMSEKAFKAFSQNCSNAPGFKLFSYDEQCAHLGIDRLELRRYVLI